jgi:hypothetical protein
MAPGGAHIRVHMDKIKRNYPLVRTPGWDLVDDSNQWSIVLTNVGSSPAHDVHYMLESASGVPGESLGAEQKQIPLLSGNGARERIGVTPRRSTAARISLKLTWRDDEGSKERYSEIEVGHDEYPFALRIIS